MSRSGCFPPVVVVVGGVVVVPLLDQRALADLALLVAALEPLDQRALADLALLLAARDRSRVYRAVEPVPRARHRLPPSVVERP